MNMPAFMVFDRPFPIKAKSRRQKPIMRLPRVARRSDVVARSFT